MQSDQGTCPARWSTEELPGAVCPQSAVAWGSSVSTLRVGVLRFTGSCRQLCTGKRGTAHWASQPSWEDELLSRDVYFVHRINAVCNHCE